MWSAMMTWFLIILIGLAPLMVYIADAYVQFLPNIPDSALYMNQFLYGLTSRELGVRTYYWVYVPFQALFGPDPIVSVILNGLFNALAAILLWGAYSGLVGKCRECSLQVYAVLFLVWPSLLLYSSAPLRESLLLFSWALLFYGLTSESRKGPAIAGLGLTGVIMVREELLPIVVVGSAIMFLAVKVYKQGIYKTRYAIVILVTLLAGAVIVLRALDLEYLLSPQRLAWERNSAANRFGADMVYGHVSWRSWWDVARDAPWLFVQLMFSPFGAVANPFSLATASLDAIFVGFVGGLSVYHIMRSASGNKLVIIWFFIAVMVGVGIAIGEYHVTGAVRHRIPCIALFLPPAARGLHELVMRARQVYVRDRRRLQHG